MKKIPLWLIVLLYLAFTASAQNLTFRNLNTNQFGSNSYQVSLKSGVVLTNPVIRGSITITGAFSIATGTNLPVSGLSTNGGTPGQVVTAQANGTPTWSNAPPATGNGSALTNLVSDNFVYSTNQANVTVLTLNNRYQDFSTNNNVAYTGFTGWNTAETNVSWASVLVTNTSGSLKTITFAGCVGDATVYVTNQSAFTVLRYPKRGTNVVGRSLN